MGEVYSNYYQNNQNINSNPLLDQNVQTPIAEQGYEPEMEMLEGISPSKPSNVDLELLEPLPEVQVEHPGQSKGKKKTKNKDANLSDSQKRLKQRFIDNKKDVRKEFKEIQQKLQGINQLGTEGQVKALRELDSLISDLEVKDDQLETLEETAKEAGLKVSSNLTEKIEKLKGNFEVKLGQAKDNEAIENQAKLEQIVAEENQKVEEARQRALEIYRKEAREVIHQARDLIGDQYGSASSKSDNRKKFNVESEKLLFLISDSIVSQNWNQVISKINDLVNSDNNMKDDILAGVGLVLMTELSPSHLKLFPENVIKKLIDGIAKGDKPHIDLVRCYKKPESDFVVDYLKSENSGFEEFYLGKDTHYRVTGLDVAEGLQRLSDFIRNENQRS